MRCEAQQLETRTMLSGQRQTRASSAKKVIYTYRYNFESVLLIINVPDAAVPYLPEDFTRHHQGNRAPRALRVVDRSLCRLVMSMP